MTVVALYWVRAMLWQLIKSRGIGGGVTQLPKGIGSEGINRALSNPLWLTAHFVRSVVASTSHLINEIEELFQPPFDIQHEQLSTVLHSIVVYNSLWTSYHTQREAPMHHHHGGHCAQTRAVMGYIAGVERRVTIEIDAVSQKNSEFGRRLRTARACLPRLVW